MSSLRTYAAKYASLGYGVVPLHWVRDDGICSCGNHSCPKPAKHPLTQHGASEPIIDPEIATQQWDATPQANIGLVAKTSRWLILDIDSEEARDYFRSIADDETITAMRTAPINKTGNGWHIIFTDPTGEYSPSVGTGDNLGIDIRVGVSYIVAPPSVHVSGHQYRWVQNEPPFDPPAPTRWLLEYLDSRASDKAKIIIDDQTIVKQGGRNQAMTELGGAMRRRGFGQEEIKAALILANQRINQPPLSEREIGGIAHSLAKYEPSDLPRSMQDAGIDMQAIDEIITNVDDIDTPSLGDALELLNVREMMETDPPEINWVWSDYLARGTLNLLHGDAGLGKSMISLAIASHCTTGTELLGRACASTNVVIIDAENSQAEIHRRIRTAYDRVSNADRLHYYRADDAILGQREATAELFAWIKRETSASLFILDSQRALWNGDEKEQGEAGRMLRYLARVAEALDICILEIHHDTKAGAYSGSSDISAALTGSRLHLKRAAKKDDPDAEGWNERHLVHAKCRMGAEQPIEQFRIELSTGIDLARSGPTSDLGALANRVLSVARLHDAFPIVPLAYLHDEIEELSNDRTWRYLKAHMKANRMIDSEPGRGQKHMTFATNEAILPN